MGIKKLINKGTCFECGIGLIVPSWKWCEIHGPQRRSRKSKLTPRQYSSLTFKCDREKALQSDLLIYDENMDIIGYKNPLIKLKV